MPTLTGIGELFRDGKSAGRGRYRVEYSEPTPMKLGHIEGDIALDMMTAFTLINDNAELTLHLADGKRWDCFLQNSEGHLVNRSGGKGLYTA